MPARCVPNRAHRKQTALAVREASNREDRAMGRRQRNTNLRIGRRVPFLEAANRVTGFSTPVFGIQWNPPILDVDVARKLLIYLGDRRVLFNPFNNEIVSYCRGSVNDMRVHLTGALQQVGGESLL